VVEHLGEARSETGTGIVEDLTDRGARHAELRDTGLLARTSEKTQDGHGVRVAPTSPAVPVRIQRPGRPSGHRIRVHRGRSGTVRRVTQLLVVRHGESEWNAVGRWQGQEDPPLTDLGRDQALQAARAVGALDAVVCSPLDRARTTAEIIAEEIGVGPVTTMEGLVERHAGAWQGLTRDEIEERDPGALAAGRRPDGWEDDDVVRTRVLDAFDRVHRDHPYGFVLAVAHAGVIFAAEAAMGAPWERIGNLGGRWFVHDGSGWRLGDRVHLLISETVPDAL